MRVDILFLDFFFSSFDIIFFYKKEVGFMVFLKKKVLDYLSLMTGAMGFTG
jgi:hypothetical protein